MFVLQTDTEDTDSQDDSDAMYNFTQSEGDEHAAEPVDWDGSDGPSREGGTFSLDGNSQP